VADLTETERENFVDKWLIRAQKMHDDDVLLTRGKRRRGTKKTSAQQQRISEAGTDVTDRSYVLLLLFCRSATSKNTGLFHLRDYSTM